MLITTNSAENTYPIMKTDYLLKEEFIMKKPNLSKIGKWAKNNK